MKNVTVTMDEAVLEWVRVKAARENISVSRWLGEVVAAARLREGGYQRAMRAALKFDPLNFPPAQRYLSRDAAARNSTSLPPC